MRVVVHQAVSTVGVTVETAIASAAAAPGRVVRQRKREARTQRWEQPDQQGLRSFLSGRAVTGPNNTDRRGNIRQQ